MSNRKLKTMKKLVNLIVLFFVFSSCINNTDFEIISSVTGIVSVSIPQTNETPHSSDNTISIELNDIASNLDNASEINIDALSYTFTNVDGNTNGVIQTASLSINTITVADVTNINISQEEDTVFEITDATLLNQIEQQLLSGSELTIRLTTSTLSDESPVSFDIEVAVTLSANF